MNKLYMETIGTTERTNRIAETYKRRITPKWVSAILLLCAIGVMAAAGLYKKQSSFEGSGFKLGFPQISQNQMVFDNGMMGHQGHSMGDMKGMPLKSTGGVIDLAKQSWPKSWIQPWTVAFSSGFGNGVRNNGKTDYIVRFEITNFPGTYHIETDNLRSTNTPLERNFKVGESTGLTVTFDIGKEARNSALVYKGLLKAIDVHSGQVLGSTPLVIINSKQDPTGEIAKKYIVTSGGGH